MKIDAAELNMNLYDEKSDEYFSRARTEIAPLLQQSNGMKLRALEVGCSEGHTLDWLKRSGHCSWVAGIEPYAKPHTSIATIDQFDSIDIEKAWPNIPNESLDLILCLDVLEHLINPWETIKKLDTLLKPGGRMIISLPNIRNYHVLIDLAFFGKFSYTESGILDRTHLRFFTRQSAIDLVQAAGARVTSIFSPESARWQKRLLRKIGLEDLIAKQYILLAIKPSQLPTSKVVGS